MPVCGTLYCIRQIVIYTYSDGFELTRPELVALSLRLGCTRHVGFYSWLVTITSVYIVQVSVVFIDGRMQVLANGSCKDLNILINQN